MVALELKDDIFVANLMSSLNPEPWELRKRLPSFEDVDRLKRRVRNHLENPKG